MRVIVPSVLPVSRPESGSSRVMYPSVLTTQSDPNAESAGRGTVSSSARGVGWPIRRVAVTWSYAGSIFDRPRAPAPTQTACSVAANAVGDPGSEIDRTGLSDVGSTRVMLLSSRFATQREPTPATIA